MEILNYELDKLVDKIERATDFKSDLENLKSIYPFSRYEYIISTLLAKNILTYEIYLDLRDSYINRNLFLYVFEISAPRGFGDTWAFSHLMSVEPELKRPSKTIEATYNGEYDLYLLHSTKNIKIEVKASRAVDRDKSDEPLYVKALSSSAQNKFLMNFQQLKPSCCDVFIWLAVYRDCVKYWVIKSEFIRNHPDFTPQHRGQETAKRKKGYDKSEIFEGQIMITNRNINTIDSYLVEGRDIRRAIIKEFEK